MTPGQIASYKAARALYNPSGRDTVRRSADQRTRDGALLAHRVLGELMERVPVNIRVSAWAVQGSGSIDVFVSGYQLSGHVVRGTLMLLAEQFGLAYAEREHSSTENMVVAIGNYREVPVRFWRLVPPCNCKSCEAGR